MAIELEDFCNTVQQGLNQLAGDNYPALKREQNGFLSAVNSETNRSGFSQKYIEDDGAGKQKQVLIEWIQPVPVDETVSSEQDVCDTGTEAAKLRDVVTLTGFASSRVIEFSEAQLRKYCEAPSEHIAMVVSAHMSGLFRKINQTLITKYLAQVGGFIGGVAAGRNLELLHYDGVSEAAKPDGEVLLMEDMADLGVSRPIVVGSGIVSRYAKLADIGCCNDYGQDIAQLQAAWDFYRDRDVDIQAGTSENIIAFSPGAVQMTTYNKYRGEFKKFVNDSYAHTTIVDPVEGLEIDMKMKYDDCTEKYRMAYFLNFDLHALPLTLFKDTDERDGVNYSFLYKGVRTT